MEKKKFRFKYPKFLILLAVFVLAYFLFKNPNSFPFATQVVALGLVGAFIAGILFSYGFTAPLAIVLFLLMAPTASNIFMFAVVGGFGALLSDLVIFHIIRFSLKDEVERLAREPVVKYLNKSLSHQVRNYLLPVLGSFIIASPLPDEIGVALLAVSHNISPRLFILLSFTFNTLGILLLILIGQAI